jgi:topoisomerase-4 subunit B
LARGNYDEASVRVLKGLQPVKERPGMYTRTTDPTHIVQEAIDNAADEALGGYATRIDVTVHADDSVTVRTTGAASRWDRIPKRRCDGRGRVHAAARGRQVRQARTAGRVRVLGRPARRRRIGDQRAVEALEVEVKRDGKVHRIVFANGDVAEKLKVIGTCGPRNTGTLLRIYPDPKYFDAPRASIPDLTRLLRAKAVLLPGVKVSLHIEKGKERKTQTWSYPQGLKGYLDELAEGAEPVAPIFEGETYYGKPKEGDIFAEGEGAAWAFAWYDEGGGHGESYVNLIPTAAGGTHEAGFRAGLFDAVKSFVDHHSLLPRGRALQTEDISAKLHYVLSARILDPQFQGQVKEKLTSRDALKLVAQVLRDPFEVWLNAHPDHGGASPSSRSRRRSRA